MRGIFASSALVVLLLNVALADHHHHHRGSEHSHEGQPSSHILSAPNANFAFALYKSLNAKADAGKNIFYSPLGISTALSMLSTGARGETHNQLCSSLGYSTLNQTQVNEAYKHRLGMLGQSRENQHLDVGNAVVVHSDFSPIDKFLNDIRQYYSGEIFNVDFAKPAEAAAEINRHIANKTHDKIKDMVKDLDPTTVMVLINYVYFSALWRIPFNPRLTSKEDFHVDENKNVEVDMMRRTGLFDFYRDDQNHSLVVKLPYKGSTSMMIVLPNEGKMKEVEDAICKDHIKHWHDSLSIKKLNLGVPKFSISTEISLEDTLKELGITDAFENHANFSGMSDSVPLKVSKASHQTVLSVNERGTEAAATTTLEIMVGSTLQIPEIVTLNRPFMIFILEHSTKSILFMGKINNPTA